MNADFLIGSGLLPDRVLRHFIRKRLAQKLDEERLYPNPGQRKIKLIEELIQSPIAVHTQAANDQHYELPPDFFAAVLGSHLKYSCDYWEEDVSEMNAAEKKMLDLYLERAEIQDGQSILELGCGWGSLSLYMAERFPHCKILSVSNSASQRKFIEQRIRERGIKNLNVLTCDVNKLVLDQTFDRVVSIEMFEHMRNYRNLLANIAHWLKADGLLFVHIFCHSQYAYPFTHAGKNDWMGRHFFTGGMMPSYDLFDFFQEDLVVKKRWKVDGKHYEKTANEWLANLDRNKDSLNPLFRKVYGKKAKTWRNNWRVFFMAYAELFGYANGKEWCVGHFLFEKSAA